MPHTLPTENHYVHRAGWLRAAVLGANDGLVSTASLIIGFAASNASSPTIFLAGLAGLVAGAMSMAAGEYVSVSSQSDTERADLERERIQHEEHPEAELKHLTQIYIERGLEPETASEVARQLTEHDAIGTHAREELGISDLSTAKPLQATITSAFTFSVGAAMPLLVVLSVSLDNLLIAIAISTVIFLAILGFLGAKIGGARPLRAIARVTFWGIAAMSATALVGYLFGTTI